MSKSPWWGWPPNITVKLTSGNWKTHALVFTNGMRIRVRQGIVRDANGKKAARYYVRIQKQPPARELERNFPSLNGALDYANGLGETDFWLKQMIGNL